MYITYVCSGRLEGTCETTSGNHPGITDGDDFFLNVSSSGSATGNTLTETLLSFFESLIQPLLTNLDPNLNPEEINPVRSVIKAILTITVTFPDRDGDVFITQTFIFPIDTNVIQPPFYLSETTVSSGITSMMALTPTSASFAATLGLLLQQLNQLIPELDAQTGGVQNVGLT